MRSTNAEQKTFDFFDIFLETCILQKNSLIVNMPGIFTLDNLEECVKYFSDNPDKSKENFDTKAQKQFLNASVDVKIVFAHFIWLWNLPEFRSKKLGRKKIITNFFGETKVQLNHEYFVDGGIASCGLHHKLAKATEINYLLLLFKFIIQNKEILNYHKKESLKEAKDSLKKVIEDICLALYKKDYSKVQINDTKLISASANSLVMHNLLLYLCNEDDYEDIATDGDKKAVIKTFYSLLNEENYIDLLDDVDKSLLRIRRELSKINDKMVSFYDADLKRAWKNNLSTNDFSEVALLEFKKAIIFFGPPGTSKTFSADCLAEALIANYYFRNGRVKEHFDSRSKIFGSHIHHLQLHSNYNYEDFIVGIHLEDHKSIPKLGYLLKLIEEMETVNDGIPHVLILDEINRVDISRLFGELFSALEYRDKEIELSVGNYKIKIPNNLYFIGTMNEIDFSLERIDFALRRRFLWVNKGFESESLQIIVDSKINDYKLEINDDDVEEFIDRCEKLNDKVSSMPELGNNYQIGHTFFAEIIDIYRIFSGLRDKSPKLLDRPIKILWEISINSILSAFMGNLEETLKITRLKELKKIFIPEDEKNK